MNLFLELLRSPKLRAELMRRIRNLRFERMENGELFIPEMKIELGGVFKLEHFRKGDFLGEVATSNVVVNEGLDYILDVAFSGASQLSSWYVSIFEGNVTPDGTYTAANYASNATELTGKYDEATRPAWTEAGVSSQNITNSASKASFGINSDSTTIYGAGLHSDNTKGGTTGTLAAAGRFSSSRSADSGDDVLVTYSLTAQDA